MKKAANQSHPATDIPAPETIEAYIAAVPEPARTKLRELREIIRSVMPTGAVEVISYGMPAFALPKPFFGYAAFTKHLSVLPFNGSLFDSFTKELASYERTRSSLHLPFDKALPAALIRKLVRAGIAGLPAPKGTPSKQSSG